MLRCFIALALATTMVVSLEPGQPACYICGDEIATFQKVEEMVTFLPVGAIDTKTMSCELLEELGRTGFLQPEECQSVQADPEIDVM